jgi:hypothetical protein
MRPSPFTRIRSRAGHTLTQVSVLLRTAIAETLALADWRAREAQHQSRADAFTASHRARKSRGETHAIEDFLFTYYPFAPAQLRRWHPGAGVALEGAASEHLDAQAPGRAEWKFYIICGDQGADLAVDAAAMIERRGPTIDFIERLLTATIDRTPSYGCFGLHEWAMVYRMTPDQIRHRALPLRLGAEPTDLVVEANPIHCSHFDAYRFFTPEAAPLNELRPTRENQFDTDQAGCLHAGMDVYKWATKLGPLVPGELLLDTFELARDIRSVDMRASPYDVSGYGLRAITIETADGKREYAQLQQGFAERGNALRLRVLEAISATRTAAFLAG